MTKPTTEVRLKRLMEHIDTLIRESKNPADTAWQIQVMVRASRDIVVAWRKVIDGTKQ